MATVYIDRVFALNFLADYLLLLAAVRLAGAPFRRWRLAVSALLGGAYAVAAFLPGSAFLAGPAGKLLAGCGIALFAFWPQRRRLQLAALFFLLSGTLAGLLLAVGLIAGHPVQYLKRVYRAEISWPVFMGAVVLFYVLLHVLFRRSIRHGGGEILRVTVRIGGNNRDILALHDTGNTLCDPVNGDPVLVLEQRAVFDLWPPEIGRVLEESLSPEEKMARLYQMQRGRSFSLIPFRSVGVPAGLLLAFRCDRITVENRVHRRALIALSEGPLSDGGAYQALWGGEEGRSHDRDLAGHTEVDPILDHAG